MKRFTERDLLEADRSWRINFINSLIGFKNLHVLITAFPEGGHNAAIFNSGLHIGSSPPYVGFLLRPTSVPRHTYQNLLAYPYATLNAVSETLYHQAHQTHQRLPYGESELTYFGLETTTVPESPLPFLREAPIRALLRLSEEHFITVNHTRLLIFAVVWAEVNGEIGADGFIRLDEMGLVAGSGCDGYYQPRFLQRGS